MTVKEYNEEFLPNIDRADIFLHGIDHALQKTDDYEGAVTQLKCIGWCPDCQDTIMKALEYYKQSVKLLLYTEN